MDCAWWVEQVCGCPFAEVKRRVPEVYRPGRPTRERRELRAELEADLATIIATGQVRIGDLAEALGIPRKRVSEGLRRDARRCTLERVVSAGRGLTDPDDF